MRFALYCDSDFADIHGLLSNPLTDKFNALGLMKSVDQTANVMAPLLENHTHEHIHTFTIVVSDKVDGSFIGLLGMILKRDVYRSADIWYKLLPSKWGKGLATESVNWLLKFAFENLNLHRVSAGCAVENIGSYRVMEKVGMRKEGVSVQNLPLDTGWSDTFEYAILESEYADFKQTNH